VRCSWLLIALAACGPAPIVEPAGVPVLWLTTGRVGVPYRSAIPGVILDGRTDGPLPEGLGVAIDGTIGGTPRVAGHTRTLARARGGDDSWVRLEISILPQKDLELAALKDGVVARPHAVATWDGLFTADGAPTRGVRLYFPADGGRPAAGRFPLVVFQHGSVPLGAAGAAPHLRFAPLLARWASHGFVVATADALDLLLAEGADTPEARHDHLLRLSANQRAAIAYLRRRVRDPHFELAPFIDADRVIVAGHSRGGAASLLSLEADASLLGAILLKPVDPLLTAPLPHPSPLPQKPVLLIIAEHDLDVAFPMADFLYERRRGPMAAVTLLGDVHPFSCGEGCPPEDEERGLAAIAPEHDWAVSNSYAVPFLKYVGGGDLDAGRSVFGSPGLSSDQSPLGVLVRSDLRAGAVLVDDFQDGDVERNALGLPQRTGGVGHSAEGSWLKEVPNELSRRFQPYVAALYDRPAFEALARGRILASSEGGESYATELGGLDVSGRERFVFRALSLDQPLRGADVALRFADQTGHAVTLNAAPYTGVNGLGGRFSDLALPLSALRSAGLDLEGLSLLEIRLETQGALFLDDLRFE
jgi:hypothetical protein